MTSFSTEHVTPEIRKNTESRRVKFHLSENYSVSNKKTVSLFLKCVSDTAYHSPLFDFSRSAECLDLSEAGEGDLDLKP